MLSAFSCNGFAIKLADFKGWFKESETTPVIVFWEKAGRENSIRLKDRRTERLKDLTNFGATEGGNFGILTNKWNDLKSE